MRLSVQGVKSLVSHFACLCREFDFYVVKKKYFFIPKNMLQIKVLSSDLLAHKTLRIIGSLGLSYFPFIFLCVNLLR